MPFRSPTYLRECRGKSHLQDELLPLHKVALDLALEERDTSADENDSECGQNSHIQIDPLEAGILEQKILQRVHGVSEWIDHGDPSQPHGKPLCRVNGPRRKVEQGI